MDTAPRFVRRNQKSDRRHAMGVDLMQAGTMKDGASLTLVRKEEIAKNIFEFELRHADGHDLPAFTAGAHVNVQAPNGMVRKYSLCNDPAERAHYVFAVKRETAGRGGSVSLIDNTGVGQSLTVSAPVNNFELPARANSFVFIAGGIGITPIMSMVRHLKTEPDKNFRLYYCARSPEEAAYREELGGPEYRGKVKIHYDGGDPEKALDLWPALEERKNLAHIFCCGPRALMEATRDMSGHWPSSAVHFEAFGDAETRKAADTAFTVELARSADVIDVPAGVTILEAMRARGHDVPSSCESGSCGTCRTKLLQGQADHRDFVLTDGERDSQIMICVSRAHSPRLVIDR